MLLLYKGMKQWIISIITKDFSTSKKTIIGTELFTYEMEAKKLQKGNIGQLFDDDIPS